MTHQVAKALLLLTGLSCAPVGTNDRETKPTRSTIVVATSVCARIERAGMPSRRVQCPPGTEHVVLGADGRFAATGEGALPPSTSPSATPRIRVRIRGVEQQWCSRRNIRHGPYLARFTGKNLVVSGQFENGKKVGEWSFWTSNGRLLRVEEYRTSTASNDPLNSTYCR